MNFCTSQELCHINISGLLLHYFTSQPCALTKQTTHSLIPKLQIALLPLPLLIISPLICLLFPLMTISFPKPSSNTNSSMKTFLIAPNSKWSLSCLRSFLSALKCHTLYLSYLYLCLSSLVTSSEGKIHVYEADEPIMSRQI